jgi:hypothetical protein
MLGTMLFVLRHDRANASPSKGYSSRFCRRPVFVSNILHEGARPATCCVQSVLAGKRLHDWRVSR